VAGGCGFGTFSDRLDVNHLHLTRDVCWGWYEFVGRHFIASEDGDWLGSSFWLCW
jgi:hypothetical protein